MAKTPIYSFRFPPHLREAIKKRIQEGELPKWLIAAIQEKLLRDKK